MDYLGIFLALIGIAAGILIFLRPAQVIRFQINFYARINWRMEPISMSKELKNTKDMGLFLAIASLLAIVCIKLLK